jgi:hypothetical protein
LNADFETIHALPPPVASDHAKLFGAVWECKITVLTVESQC